MLNRHAVNPKRRGQLFALHVALGIGALAWSGTQIDGYLLYVLREPLPHPYPWLGVLTMSGVLAGEALAFYLILPPRLYGRSWRRSLAALALCLGLALYFGSGLIHVPPYFYWHFYWLALSVLLLLALLGVSVVRATRRRG